MLYLSQLILNPRDRRVQGDLRDPYEMHRTLARGFADNPDEYAQARCLFRLEERASDGLPFVLVQSRIRPNWTALEALSEYLAAPARIKEFAPALPAGQRLAFRLLANPTVCRDGKRRGLVTEKEQSDWLNRKAQAGGFRLQDLRIQNVGPLESRRSGAPPAIFSQARFEGVLVVQDQDLFQQTLHSGIGPAKGYGFGLLSLARAG